MSFGIEVLGEKEIQRAFRNLKQGVRNDIVEPAVRFAMLPVREAATRTAPVGKGPHAGLLKKSIGTLVRRYKGAIVGLVGPRVDAKFKIPVGKTREGKVRYKNPAKYAHLVEKGTKRGVEATHFLRNAMLNNKRPVLQRLGSKIKERIPTVVGKQQIKKAKRTIVGKAIQAVSPSIFK